MHFYVKLTNSENRLGILRTEQIAVVFIIHPPQEIDAITTQPSSEDAGSHSSLPTTNPPRPEVNNQQQSAVSEGPTQQSTEFEYNTQYSLAAGNCCISDQI